ncbi:hepatocyte growth factor activator-like isoform X2 [Narcine bancroftii]|uniref:hepatocyte growth factor activator-like isoform X2 n=1 Tax=Narcine bancroftii TaxID=1343680 RepID=UPI0038323342
MLGLYSVAVVCCYFLGGTAKQAAETFKLGVPRDGHEDQGSPHPLHHHRTVFTAKGLLCAFPFRYGGKLHRTCLPSKKTGKKWCATTHNYDKESQWDHCEEIQPLEHDHCENHACWHGGACVNNPRNQSYTCLCRDPFTGEFCEKNKCFERQHLKYYNIGETWTRILHGDVERCFCTKEGIRFISLSSKACERNPCHNGGECLEIRATGERVCSCSKGHAGKRCKIDSASDCYKDNGSSYRGKADKTASGTDCLHWTSELISMEFDIRMLEDPHILGVGDHRYCRNLDHDEKPWCYTLMNDIISWDHCAVPQCPVQDPCLSNPCQNGGTCFRDSLRKSYYCQCHDRFSGADCQTEKCLENTHHRYFHIGQSWNRVVNSGVEHCVCGENGTECHSVAHKDKNENCYRNNGVTYKGTEDETESKIECMPWKEDFVRNRLNITSLEEAFQLGLGDHSYCRNPDGDTKPWCYIILGDHISWEHCDIPKCGTATIYARRPPPLARMTGSKAPKQPPLCGKRHHKIFRPRIVGGSVAMRGSHPWIAAIYIGSNFCTGTLIYPCWVISAAHCFLHSPLKSSIRVVLGQHYFNKSDKHTQEFEITKYILHHEYSPFEETRHDIALLKLKKIEKACATQSRFVRPLCLPNENDFFREGSLCQIAGWGHTKEDATEYAKILQEASVSIISQLLCSSDLFYGSEVTPNMICAGDLIKSIDACQGDSGGPLVCYKDQVGYLYGIVSWGDGCGKMNKPGVYTRVTNYMDWIYRITKRRP